MVSAYGYRNFVDVPAALSLTLTSASSVTAAAILTKELIVIVSKPWT